MSKISLLSQMVVENYIKTVYWSWTEQEISDNVTTTWGLYWIDRLISVWYLIESAAVQNQHLRYETSDGF